MSLAEETRAAVREHPFLFDALRAGVLNYTAAARFLDLGETDAVAAALRRFADDLDPYERPTGAARVTIQRGLGEVPTDAAAVVVGEVGFDPDSGSLAGILATGADPALLEPVLARLRTADVPVRAAAAADDRLRVVVGERDGPRALRVVEAVVRS